MGPLELRGPLGLQGIHFLSAAGSTVLVTGYLLIAARWCGIAQSDRAPINHLKIAAALLPVFLPPFVPLAIRLAALAS